MAAHGNPDVHDHVNLPILMPAVERAAQGGRHISMRKPTPLANLHLTLPR